MLSDVYKQNKSLFHLFIGFFILYFVVHFLSITLTKFQKTVVVSEKYVKPSKNYSYYQFIDSENETYRLADSVYLLEFDSGDDYARLKVGQKYKIYGYWFRYPLLSWFPLVYKVSDI